MKKSLIIIFLLLNYHIIYAQIDSVKIQTSAQCERCKETLEYNLKFEKGVKSSNLNLKDKSILVVYNSSKTDVSKIRIAISKSGYDADTIKAEIKAYEKLHYCCKKPD